MASPATVALTRSPRRPFPADEIGLGLIFGLVFLLAGVAFKVSAVPFHMWTPDVYEGSPTPVTAFFAAAPKVAAMAVFVRIVHRAFGRSRGEWQQIVVFISIASMVLGAFAAIGQENIKRLMAYSSIGHMGYALVGLAAGTQAGVRGVIHLHGDLLVMTLGTFACMSLHAAGDGTAVERSTTCPGCPHRPDDGADADHVDVLAGRHSAAGRLLRQVFRLCRGDRSQALRPRHYRCAGLGWCSGFPACS
jgi:NADH:ubiquinone oxidoreductase subunit 2 (subunit N)